jgi:hypothetical protein
MELIGRFFAYTERFLNDENESLLFVRRKLEMF